MNRRDFFRAAAGTAFLTGAGRRAWGASDMGAEILEYRKPVFNLHKFFNAPVKIASIELLEAYGQHFLRTRSADGAEGIIRTKDIEDYVSILEHRVRPHFLGKDARDLEHLVDEVYVTESNYKLAGQEFWCPVAYIEQSLFDLMGKALKKPAGELMGGVLRKEIPVYLSGSGRDTTAEEEVEVYVRGVESTGAKAVKFKIGGRMSDNQDAYPERTDKILELAQQKLAGKVTLMADANGSYDAKNAIAHRQAARGDEVPVVRGAVPVGGVERDQEGGRRAGDEGGVRRTGFQLVAVPMDDRQQGHGCGAARFEL